MAKKVIKGDANSKSGAFVEDKNNTANLRQLGEKYLAKEEDCQKCYVTSDGEVYIDQAMAEYHTRIIRGSKPVIVTR